MRITLTLLGVWSHADGYHYLRGFGCCTACGCLSQCRDVWVRVHPVQNRDKTVAGTCSRAHTHAADIWKCRESPWQQSRVLSKAIFCDGRLKMGSAGTSDIWWGLTLADGFQTQIFYMFVFLEIFFFSHLLAASEKAKNQTRISLTLGSRAGAGQRQTFSPMRQKSCHPLNGKGSPKTTQK